MTPVLRISRRSLENEEVEWVSAWHDARPPTRSRLDALPWSGPCELVLASDLVLLEQVSLPPAQRRRVGTALRFLVEEQVLSDPEGLHVVGDLASPGDAVAVAVVEAGFFRDLLARLRRAGLSVRGAYPECVLAPLEPQAWTVVCDGAESFARTGDLAGFSLEEPPVRVPASLQLALEHARVAGSAPQRIVVRPAAQSDAAPPAVTPWSDALGVPVELGAAWRWSDGRAPERLNLMQGEFWPGRGTAGLLPKMRSSAVLAVAVLTVFSAGLGAEWAYKARERQRTLAEMARVYRDTFGERGVVVDAQRQWSRAIAELRQRAGEPTPDDFVPLVGALAGILAETGAGRVDSIAYEAGTLTAAVRDARADSVPALAERLRAHRSPAYRLSIEEPARGMVRVTLRPVS